MADQIFPRRPSHLHVAIVDVGETPVTIDGRERIAHRVDHLPKLLFDAGLFGGKAVAFRDVPRDLRDANDGAVARAQRRHGDRHIDPAAIFPEADALVVLNGLTG